MIFGQFCGPSGGPSGGPFGVAFCGQFEAKAKSSFILLKDHQYFNLITSPHSKQFNDWIRSETQNGGYPKVENYIKHITFYINFISGSKSNPTG